MVVSSLGFLLVFYVPDLELTKLETRNANVHRHKNNNNNNQGLLYLAIRPRKGQPSKKENFQTITTLIQPSTPEKKCGITSTHTIKGQVGDKDSGLGCFKDGAGMIGKNGEDVWVVSQALLPGKFQLVLLPQIARVLNFQIHFLGNSDINIRKINIYF